jgi:hypothetical protein
MHVCVLSKCSLEMLEWKPHRRSCKLHRQWVGASTGLAGPDVFWRGEGIEPSASERLTLRFRLA